MAGNSKIVIEIISLEGMLYLAEHKDWSPRDLISSLGDCFTLGEVQEMSLGGIKNVCQENKQIWEISNRFGIFGGKVKK